MRSTTIRSLAHQFQEAKDREGTLMRDVQPHEYWTKGGGAKAAAFIIFALLCVLTSSRATISRAQNTPLIMNIRGDLWTWSDAKLQQRTAWGYNKVPVL